MKTTETHHMLREISNCFEMLNSGELLERDEVQAINERIVEIQMVCN